MVGAEEKTHSVHNSAVVFPLRFLVAVLSLSWQNEAIR